MRIFLSALGWTAFGLLILLFVWLIVTNFIAFTSSTYHIKAGRTTYYAKTIEQKDGCVRFHDIQVDRDYNICGYYSIVERGQ